MIAYHPNPCKHEFQDAEYGPGFRVMNEVYEQGKVIGARCTVCCPPKEKMKKRGGVFNLNELRIKRK